VTTRKPGDWWDKSWSVVSGCTPVGAGCDNCWAAALVKRFPVAHDGALPIRVEPHGPVTVPASDFSTVITHPDRLGIPLRARKPRVYAVSLLGDLFHEQVPERFIRDVLDPIAVCNQKQMRHRFVLLTKRYERAVDAMAVWGVKSPAYLSNLAADMILLASVWDQASTDAACAAFSQLPAGIRWGLHCEPLLSAVDMRKTVTNRIGASMPRWIVCGGETGPKARPMHPDWVRGIRDQCQAAGVPFWFKGWGAWSHPGQCPEWEWHTRLDGSMDLAAPSGHVAATIYPNGTWFVWDRDGTGGENWKQTAQLGAKHEAERAVSRWAQFGRIGKKKAGRQLDGRTHDEVPW